MLHLTCENFETRIIKDPRPAVVLFYARWCGKCAMTKPMVEDVVERHQRRVRFFEVEIDESPLLADRYGTDIVPTFVFFQNGAAVSTMKGLIGEATLEQRLKEIFRNC